MRVVGWVAGMAILALLVTGCGQRTVRAAAPVQLSLQLPHDGARVLASAATVSGRVRPRAARVLVLGRHVSVGGGGRFATRVALAPGTNLIDVIASAPRARPAMLALRVIRYVLVNVPDVTGESPGAAAAALRAVGLRPVVQGDNNPFAFLLPGSIQVCGESPAGGVRVHPRSMVTLQLGKVCL